MRGGRTNEREAVLTLTVAVEIVFPLNAMGFGEMVQEEVGIWSLQESETVPLKPRVQATVFT